MRIIAPIMPDEEDGGREASAIDIHPELRWQRESGPTRTTVRHIPFLPTHISHLTHCPSPIVHRPSPIATVIGINLLLLLLQPSINAGSSSSTRQAPTLTPSPSPSALLTLLPTVSGLGNEQPDGDIKTQGSNVGR